jgi:hypothetical protein
MLSADDVRRITRLHQAGRDKPTIAADVGCALQTVYTVLRGLHTSQDAKKDEAKRRRQAPRQRERSFRSQHDYVSGEGFRRVDGKTTHCPGCGQRVTQLPCVLCQCLAPVIPKS